MMTALETKHPRPWEVEFRGSETAIVDADGNDIFSLVWDDVQLGDGGVNDVLVALVEGFNLAGVCDQ